MDLASRGKHIIRWIECTGVLPTDDEHHALHHQDSSKNTSALWS